MKRTITNGDEPSFELPVENELLMLKPTAEFSAECTTGDEDIPPAVVNDFLNQFMNSKRNSGSPRNYIKIYDKMSRPNLSTADELPRQTVIARTKAPAETDATVLGLSWIFSENIQTDVIYSFITEEFFEHEMEDLQICRVYSSFLL